MITNSRKKMFNKAFSTLVFVYGFISLALALPKGDRLKRNDESSFQSNEAAPVYLLVSTSSKIYCMKMPDEFDQLQQQQPQPQLNQQQQQLYYYRNNYYDRDSKNFAIIYEEKNHQNNWITDAFYVKSENLIYVNVYNSTSATSDIFTLKYDQMRDVWIKNVLYRDQSYCLGCFLFLFFLFEYFLAISSFYLKKRNYIQREKKRTILDSGQVNCIRQLSIRKIPKHRASTQSCFI